MVLALPILLFLMALYINYGVAASWKVRALSMARHAAFGARWPRTGSSDPDPAYWEGDIRTDRQAERIAKLDDPRANHPVMRGPLPDGNEVPVDLFDPAQELIEGQAATTQEFPLMGPLGPFTLGPSTFLIDNKWEYQRTRLSGNWLRRIPALYKLVQAASLANAYVAACGAILDTPSRSALRPLDRDDEFLYWRQWAPDFHPRLKRFCTTDLEVATEAVEDLIDRIRGHEPPPEPRIKGLAERMAEAFIALYESVIRQLETQLAAQPDGMTGLQGQIDDYQQKIDTLRQFLAKLRQEEDDNGGGNANGK